MASNSGPAADRWSPLPLPATNSFQAHQRSSRWGPDSADHSLQALAARIWVPVLPRVLVLELLPLHLESYVESRPTIETLVPAARQSQRRRWGSSEVGASVLAARASQVHRVAGWKRGGTCCNSTTDDIVRIRWGPESDLNDLVTKESELIFALRSLFGL